MTIVEYILLGIGVLACLCLLWLELASPYVKAKRVMTFEFPKGMTSADVGLYMDGRVDRRDVMSLIPWFVAQGYVRMERVDDVEMELRKDGVRTNFRLIRLQEPTSCKAYETLFFQTLFPGNCKVRELRYSYDRAFADGWYSTLDAVRAYNPQLSEPIKWAHICFPIAMVALLVLIGLDTTFINLLYTSLVFTIFPILSYVLSLILINKMKDGTISEKIKFLCIEAGCFGIFAFNLYANQENLTEVGLTATESLTGLLMLAVLLDYRLARPTMERRQRMSELLGLKEYIRCAEKEELRRIVTDNPLHFYRILSYGMAFGLTPKWERKFRAINLMLHGVGERL